jgi:hypothetical protein
MMTPDVRERILRSGFLECFVFRYCGEWGHTEWIAFLKFIQTKCGPVDADQLGILLEHEKTRYHNGAYRTPGGELEPSIKAILRRKSELFSTYFYVDYKSPPED